MAQDSQPLAVPLSEGLGANATDRAAFDVWMAGMNERGWKRASDVGWQAWQHQQREIDRLRAVMEAAQEWSAERTVRDWGDAGLLKALWTFDGDRTEPCPECDGDCGEPCAPCTVAAAHADIDRQTNALMTAGKLYGSTPPTVCGNCDTAMPTGCGGIFKDNGKHCLLNLAPNE